MYKSSYFKLVAKSSFVITSLCCYKFVFKMKLFIFVLLALFAVAFANPSPNLMKAAEVGTSVVTVPGGAVTGLWLPVEDRDIF